MASQFYQNAGVGRFDDGSAARQNTRTYAPDSFNTKDLKPVKQNRREPVMHSGGVQPLHPIKDRRIFRVADVGIMTPSDPYAYNTKDLSSLSAGLTEAVMRPSTRENRFEAFDNFTGKPKDSQTPAPLRQIIMKVEDLLKRLPPNHPETGLVADMLAKLQENRPQDLSPTQQILYNRLQKEFEEEFLNLGRADKKKDDRKLPVAPVAAPVAAPIGAPVAAAPVAAAPVAAAPVAAPVAAAPTRKQPIGAPLESDSEEEDEEGEFFTADEYESEEEAEGKREAEEKREEAEEKRAEAEEKRAEESKHITERVEEFERLIDEDASDFEREEKEEEALKSPEKKELEQIADRVEYGEATPEDYDRAMDLVQILEDNDYFESKNDITEIVDEIDQAFMEKGLHPSQQSKIVDKPQTEDGWLVGFDEGDFAEQLLSAFDAEEVAFGFKSPEPKPKPEPEPEPEPEPKPEPKPEPEYTPEEWAAWEEDVKAQWGVLFALKEKGKTTALNKTDFHKATQAVNELDALEGWKSDEERNKVIAVVQNLYKTLHVDEKEPEEKGAEGKAAEESDAEEKAAEGKEPEEKGAAEEKNPLKLDPESDPIDLVDLAKGSQSAYGIQAMKNWVKWIRKENGWEDYDPRRGSTTGSKKDISKSLKMVVLHKLYDDDPNRKDLKQIGYSDAEIELAKKLYREMNEPDRLLPQLKADMRWLRLRYTKDSFEQHIEQMIEKKNLTDSAKYDLLLKFVSNTEKNLFSGRKAGNRKYFQRPKRDAGVFIGDKYKLLKKEFLSKMAKEFERSQVKRGNKRYTAPTRQPQREQPRTNRGERPPRAESTQTRRPERPREKVGRGVKKPPKAPKARPKVRPKPRPKVRRTLEKKKKKKRRFRVVQ